MCVTLIQATTGNASKEKLKQLDKHQRFWYRHHRRVEITAPDPTGEALAAAGATDKQSVAHAEAKQRLLSSEPALQSVQVRLVHR